MNSGRGGSRPNSGRKAKYGTSETCVMRVPVQAVSVVEDAVRMWMAGDALATKGGVIDLRGVKTYILRGERVVKVASLQCLGHTILE